MWQHAFLRVTPAGGETSYGGVGGVGSSGGGGWLSGSGPAFDGDEDSHMNDPEETDDQGKPKRANCKEAGRRGGREQYEDCCIGLEGDDKKCCEWSDERSDDCVKGEFEKAKKNPPSFKLTHTCGDWAAGILDRCCLNPDDVPNCARGSKIAEAAWNELQNLNVNNPKWMNDLALWRAHQAVSASDKYFGEK